MADHTEGKEEEERTSREGTIAETETEGEGEGEKEGGGRRGGEGGGEGEDGKRLLEEKISEKSPLLSRSDSPADLDKALSLLSFGGKASCFSPSLPPSLFLSLFENILSFPLLPVSSV